MTDLILPRRKFLTGLMGLVAAPAVVKASSLMPVKAMTPEVLVKQYEYQQIELGYQVTREPVGDVLYRAQFGSMNRALLESFQRTKNQMMETMSDNLFGRTYK